MSQTEHRISQWETRPGQMGGGPARPDATVLPSCQILEVTAYRTEGWQPRLQSACAGKGGLPSPANHTHAVTPKANACLQGTMTRFHQLLKATSCMFSEAQAPYSL